MAKPQSIGIERQREYSGEEHCRQLLEWLNNSDSGRGKKSVLAVLDTYFQLQSRWVVEKTPNKAHATYTGDSKEQTRLLNSLRSQCQRYTYYPYFYPQGLYTQSRWYPAKWSGKGVDTWGACYDDTHAMLDFSLIAELGLLDRLKKCICGRWLFAKFEHQRFCSAKCREKAFRSDPAEKEKRRKWARKNYWLHKNKNVK
jgi:hypothetical protein